MKRNFIVLFFFALPTIANSQESACVALQDLLFTFIDTGREVAELNQRMGYAAATQQLFSGETELSGVVRQASQVAIGRLTEGVNAATEIVENSGCFEQR